MNESRPDPDELLAQVQAEEAKAHRGRLRIFFGAIAGVGKTYSMLEAARGAKAAGTEVVIGYVEPHGRVETERLMAGLPRIPTLPVRYRGIVRQELDLDAALRRRPAILLVDELAHSNIVGGDPPPRHAKRWQDIEELLEAGIDVWTTVNVQHLESLNDLVARITGVRQRETLPDHVFDEADEIELIDLPPGDLLARLHAGKVYVPSDVSAAVERFFRKANLTALRELALRKTASRVEAASRAAFAADITSRAWLARDRILVAVGPDTQAEQLVRAGKRMADALDAEWTVVYVETPALLKLSEVERNRRIDVLRLADSLGAETVTLDGPTAADALMEYARTRRATRVIVGAPKLRGLRALFRRSTPTELVRRKRTFDVITIAAHEPAEPPSQPPPRIAANNQRPIEWRRYALGLGVSAVSTVVAGAMYGRFDPANLVMVYLLGVTVAGLWLGRGPSVMTAILNVALFDICFVEPRYTFGVKGVEYLVTFGVMLTVALVIATLMASVRQQTRVAGARERRTALLYAMSRELTRTRGIAGMARVAVRHIAEVFQVQAVVLFPDERGKLQHPGEPPTAGSFRGADLAVAQWVMDHGRRAGLGSDTLAAAPALYLPMNTEEKTLGVLAVLPENKRRVLLPEQLHLLETFAGQIALAVERARLADEAESARVSTESESLRNTLLTSISHDLRTPLTVIAGAGSTLAERGPSLDEATRMSLARAIEGKAREVSDLVANVLDLVRFESGAVALRRDWQSIDDLAGAALNSRAERIEGRPVELNVPGDLPPVHVDALLIVQVLGNLIDNIAKYTPEGSRMAITALAEDTMVRVMVDDDGPGLPDGNTAQLFRKFQRGDREGAIVGVGLGLAICRAIVEAHGGTIEARNRPRGGARFEFTLPAAEPAA